MGEGRLKRSASRTANDAKVREIQKTQSQAAKKRVNKNPKVQGMPGTGKQ